MMIPSTEIAHQEEQVAMVADPMPTASTGPEAAEVKITEEAMPDDLGFDSARKYGAKCCAIESEP
jgi:hypothetical protein